MNTIRGSPPFAEASGGRSKGTRPLKLIYVEEFDSRASAYEREVYFKSGFGREERAIIVKKHSGIV